MASARPVVRSSRLLLPALLVLAMLGALETPARAADPDLPYGINVHLPSSAVLDRVAEAGIAWIRVDFNWNLMEPSRDVYDWSLTDSVVNDARTRGLNIFATLAYTPGWANGGQDISVPATDPADWYKFVFDTVSRYKDSVTHWGMWNEPNLDGFFSGSREEYIRDVLRLGAQAAKAADPTSFVLGPELAHLESAHWEAWLYTVLREAGDVIDIVTHHNYSSTGQAVVRDMGVPGAFWKIRTPRGIMVLTGTAANPLWLTETGWRTDLISEAQQADYYVQVLKGVDFYPWLDKVFFYEMVDDPRFPEKWGILNADLTPKEAFYRYQDYIASRTAKTPAPSP
jgi:hypothetical protein